MKENRRISKRTIKRPSYLEQFHIDDSKDGKAIDKESSRREKDSSQPHSGTKNNYRKAQGKENKKHPSVKVEKRKAESRGSSMSRTPTQKKFTYHNISKRIEEICEGGDRNHHFSLSKQEVKYIKEALHYILNSEMTRESIENSGIGKSLQLLLDKCRTSKNSEIVSLNKQLAFVQSKIRECISKYFFLDELSSESESEGCNSYVQNNMSRDFIPGDHHTGGFTHNLDSLRLNGPKIPAQPNDLSSNLLGGMGTSLVGNGSFQRHSRERINSETPNQQNSLIDLLMNNRRPNPTPHMNGYQNSRPSSRNRANSETSNLSSSIIENFLTEYLISLPSSLDEFYKIMGEIYVAEILRQCPEIKSPTQLMKETLLGNHGSTGQNSKNIISILLQHILQANQGSPQKLNPAESDVMRSLLVNNAQPSINQNFLNTQTPLELSPYQPPNATSNLFAPKISTKGNFILTH